MDFVAVRVNLYNHNTWGMSVRARFWRSFLLLLSVHPVPFVHAFLAASSFALLAQSATMLRLRLSRLTDAKWARQIEQDIVYEWKAHYIDYQAIARVGLTPGSYEGHGSHESLRSRESPTPRPATPSRAESNSFDEDTIKRTNSKWETVIELVRSPGAPLVAHSDAMRHLFSDEVNKVGVWSQEQFDKFAGE